MSHIPPPTGYPANYDISGRRKKSKAPKVVIIVVAVVATLCGGLALIGALAGGNSTSKASSAGTTPATSAAPVSVDRQICRVTGNGGTYYLLVTSATEHNFQACAGATPYAGTIDALLQLPGMDRRCILGDQYTAQNHAVVGVYSSKAAGDLAAARSFCSANGGTN
jgi:hypothetical protein